MARIKIESVHPSKKGSNVWIDIDYVSESNINTIIKNLVLYLKDQIPSIAVATAFIQAVELCPKANPSDIWQHIIYRSLLSLGYSDQQWKRISGFALEIALTEIYTPRLEPYNMRMRKMKRKETQKLFAHLDISGEVKKDKLDRIVDVYLKDGNGYILIAGLHIKASIAERIQDDVPTSRALMERGILSIMLTMDSKSYPPPHGDGINYGELGGRSWEDEKEKVRIKRQYIEDDGQFDALISYNLRTPPSLGKTKSGKRIYTISLSDNQPDILVKILKKRVDSLS